jgi:asparagine synthase (glutamine-hydrolysing)
MTQLDNHPSESPSKVPTSKSFLSPQIAGWLIPQSNGLDGEANISDMQEAINTSLPLKQAVTEEYACTSTDSIHQDNNYTVTITGYPRWSEQRLETAASEQSHAYALCLAYSEHGDKFIDYLQGAFAFVIIDTTSHHLLAGTDRMGQCPLYYAQVEGGIVFGSSVSTILSHEKIPRSIQEQGIYAYLYFHMVPSPHSIFEHIQKLPAGHRLSYNNKHVEVNNYYKPAFSETASNSFQQAGHTLRTQLKEAVINCYNPALKTAAFLSGGLDSSSVTGMLSEISETTAEAYSIGFSAEGYDEMEFARITAKHFGPR